MIEKLSARFDRLNISPVCENLPGNGVDLYIGGREGAWDIPLLRAHGIGLIEADIARLWIPGAA